MMTTAVEAEVEMERQTMTHTRSQTVSRVLEATEPKNPRMSAQ